MSETTPDTPAGEEPAEDTSTETSAPQYLPSKATAYGPGEPVPAKVTQGATFAERNAAREAAESKALDSEDAENKTVASKRTAKK